MKSLLTDKSIFEMQAEICKTLTNPKRIEILNTLRNEEKTVTELVTALGASKANVSQHLAVMRHKGILTTRRDGVNIYYRVSNPKVIEACALMKEVLFEQHAAKKKAVGGDITSDQRTSTFFLSYIVSISLTCKLRNLVQLRIFFCYGRR